jgi:hypothetical protein
MLKGIKSRIKEGVKKMENAWTETGDGTGYPEGSALAEHSGDDNWLRQRREELREEIKAIDAYLGDGTPLGASIDAQTDDWVKGMLPGGVQIMTSKKLGTFKRV